MNNYTKDLRRHLSEMRDSAMTASAMLEMSGATAYEHSHELHQFLQTVIRGTESAISNANGELDLPEYEGR